MEWEVTRQAAGTDGEQWDEVTTCANPCQDGHALAGHPRGVPLLAPASGHAVIIAPLPSLTVATTLVCLVALLCVQETPERLEIFACTPARAQQM